MKINISSKSISIGIYFLIFVAIGIMAITFIGTGKEENMLSFDDYSVMEYSEHDGWTDVSISENENDNSSEESSENESDVDLQTIITEINSKFSCNGSETEEMFSDEMGIKISQISFLNEFTPENVSYSLGYVFANDKIFDLDGNDLTVLLDGFSFVGGRDKDGNVLFEKDGKYYFVKNGSLLESLNVGSINRGTSYSFKRDDEPILFKSGDKWGAKNSDDKILIKAVHSKAHGFYEGIGCFSTQTNYLYFYTKDGKLISSDYKIPTSGKGSLRFYNGITLVSNGKNNLVLKSSGKLLDIPSDYKVLGCLDGVILLEKNGYFGYMNSNGQWITNPLYKSASDFVEGLAVVSDKTSKIIDRDGNTVIPEGFDYISGFSNSKCILYSKEYGWYKAVKYFEK